MTLMQDMDKAAIAIKEAAKADTRKFDKDVQEAEAAKKAEEDRRHEESVKQGNI